MKSEIRTVSQLKAELKSELENRIESVETELKELQAGFSELKGFVQANDKRLDGMIDVWNKHVDRM